MCLNVIWLICCILLLTCGFAENSRCRPIVDLQHAQPRILGAASRSDLHPGSFSPTIVYYPSVAITQDNHDNAKDQDDEECASTSASGTLESNEHSMHPLHGYYSDYSMVSNMKDS